MKKNKDNKREIVSDLRVLGFFRIPISIRMGHSWTTNGTISVESVPNQVKHGSHGNPNLVSTTTRHAKVDVE